MKLIVIKAIQWKGSNLHEILFKFIKFDQAEINTDGDLFIHTLDGLMKANIGDYIIKIIDGEAYPCKPNLFHKYYYIKENSTDE